MSSFVLELGPKCPNHIKIDEFFQSGFLSMIKSNTLIVVTTNSYFGIYPQMTGPISPGAVQRSFSEEFLTCPVCFEYYNEPRQLNCLHSFCTTCVDAIIQQNKAKGYFPCPMCMMRYDIPENGASDFKLDFR